MKLAVIGAGRVDVITQGAVSPDIKDPFLILTRELCNHFDQVSVEINVPLHPLEGQSALKVLGRLQLSYVSQYSSFLNYFTRLCNFTPEKIRQLSQMIKNADVVLLRIPGPVVFLAALLCRYHGRPYVTFVASDLHQIKNNLINASSFVTQVKGWVINCLVLILKFQVIGRATRRLYLSQKMLTDYCDTESEKSALFATSIVQRVHTFIPTKVGKGSVRMIFVGRLVAEKGLMELVDICDQLTKSGLIVFMDVVGDGREAETFSVAFSNLSLNNAHLVLHGWVSDREYLDKLMVAADFCLLPSHNEGTPKVIYEAWASSTIFVGTRVGGIPSVVQDGVDGVLFDVGDTYDAATKIRTMIDNPARINEMNQIATGRAVNYTLQATAKKLAFEIQACFE